MQSPPTVDVDDDDFSNRASYGDSSESESDDEGPWTSSHRPSLFLDVPKNVQCCREKVEQVEDTNLQPALNANCVIEVEDDSPQHRELLRRVILENPIKPFQVDALERAKNPKYRRYHNMCLSGVFADACDCFRCLWKDQVDKKLSQLCVVVPRAEHPPMLEKVVEGSERHCALVRRIITENPIVSFTKVPSIKAGDPKEAYSDGCVRDPLESFESCGCRLCSYKTRILKEVSRICEVVPSPILVC